MSCTNPLYALKLGTDPVTQKLSLKILPRRVDYNFKVLSEKYGKDNILMLPCGSCLSCIESRTRAWAARCVLEASSYEKNCFITLSYKDSCLPKNGLFKKDLQNFFKRLRKVTKCKIKYFACGEYGGITKRPHYHAIIFNWFPEDAEKFAIGSYGGFRYHSAILDKLWSYGFTEVGEVSYASCAYVARYCQKKLSKSIFETDNDGVVSRLVPEFSLMSKNLGYKYFDEHKDDIYDTDKIYFPFGEGVFMTSPFKYFDKLMENYDPTKLAEVKQLRISKSELTTTGRLLDLSFSNVENLFKRDEENKLHDFERLKRTGV